jgi:CRP-like cAMP-binding protein
MLAKHQLLLRSIPLFAGLSPKEHDTIAALAEIRTYATRKRVVTQGDPARALFAVVRGRLKVVSSGPDGRDAVLGIMGKGEVFGEVALLDGGPRSATVTALEPCELLIIERDAFMTFLERSPSVAVKLLKVLAGRLRRLSHRSEDAAFLDVPSRLARSLIDLASRFGEREPPDDIRITLKISQQELGDLIGAARESINKHLKDWKRRGYLKQVAGYMVIADIEHVRRLARIAED